MATEVERKFLVATDAWRAGARGARYCQGYIDTSDDTTVRIRIAGEEAFITVKGPTSGITRAEFEYPIPLEDAQAMLRDLCRQPLISRPATTCLMAARPGRSMFFGAENSGLVLAEIELDHRRNRSICRHGWGRKSRTIPLRNSALSSEPIPRPEHA